MAKKLLLFIILLSSIVSFIWYCSDYQDINDLEEASKDPQITQFVGPYSENSLTNTFELYFNKEMLTISVESSLKIIRKDLSSFDTLSEPAIFQWIDNKHLKIIVSKLSTNTSFIFSVQTTALTLYGNKPLKSPFIKEFMINITDTERPIVESYNPTIDILAPLNTIIMVTFNKPMNEDSVYNSLSVKDAIGNTIKGGRYYDEVSYTLFFYPLTYLNISSSYTVTVNTNAVDLNNISLSSSFKFTFNTGSDADNIAPTVLPITLNNNGEPRYTNTPIGIWFSEQMNINYLPSSIVILGETDYVTIQSAHYKSDNSFWLYPENVLSTNVIYTVQIISQAIDLAGNPISNAPFIFQFTLAEDNIPPEVISVSPHNSDTEISLDSPIKLFFSEGMNRNTVESSFILREKNSGVVKPGSYSWNSDSVMEFTPSNYLSSITIYQYEITTNAKDKAGNALKQNYSAQFTTLDQSGTSILVTLLSSTLSSGTITPSSVVLNWTSSTGADGYKIFFTTGTCSTLQLNQYEGTFSGTSATISPLIPNTNYSFYITAYNRLISQSQYSNCCNITTADIRCDFISPTNSECLTSNNIVITGTASDNYGVITSVSLTVDASSILTTGTNNWTGTATSLSDGVHSISLIVYDNSGGASIHHNIIVTIDTTLSIIQVNTPTSSFNVCNYSVPLSGSYSISNCKTSSIQYRIENGTWSGVTYMSNGIWSNNNIISGLTGSGDHTIQVNIIENSVSGPSSYYNLSTYYLVPSIQILTPLNEHIYTDSTSSINFYGTYTGTNTCCNKTIKLSIDNSSWTNVASIGVSEWTHTPISASSLTENLHSVKVNIADDCGMSNTSICTMGYLVMSLKPIPGGTFVMGYSGLGSDTKMHTVQITGYSMLESEVTIGQYCQFLNLVEKVDHGTSKWNINMSSDAKCGISRSGVDGSYTYTIIGGRDNYPMSFVNWQSSCDFCKCISGTLPSEAQWEYAAGGSNHFSYSLGNTFISSDYCFSNSTTCVVKSHTANDYGLYDMSGNVWEWSLDWYSGSYYQSCFDLGTVTDPVNSISSSYNSIRGGSYASINDTTLYVFYRDSSLPNSQGDYLGFRCVR